MSQYDNHSFLPVKLCYTAWYRPITDQHAAIGAFTAQKTDTPPAEPDTDVSKSNTLAK